MSASRSSSSAEVRSPDRDPDARGHRHARLFVRAELERLLERFEQALGDQLGPGRRARAPRRSRRTRRRRGARARRRRARRRPACAATARSSSSPAACPSVSLIVLKLSRSMNSAATGVWLRRARASICSTRSRISVRFGRPVSGSWVARNASSSSRRASSSSVSLALALEALAHPHEAELEAQLQHVQGLRERLSGTFELRGALAQHLGHHVAPRTGSAWSPRSARPRGGPPARRRSATFPGRLRSRPRCPRPRSSAPPRSSSWCRSARSSPGPRRPPVRGPARRFARPSAPARPRSAPSTTRPRPPNPPQAPAAQPEAPAARAAHPPSRSGELAYQADRSTLTPATP